MQMMGGGDGEMSGMGDMSAMMQGAGSRSDMLMMPKMMTTMMPECLNVMLPYVPPKKRTDFSFRLVTTLMKNGGEEMSAEKREKFMARLQKAVKG
jgi:hypothetical protein